MAAHDIPSDHIAIAAGLDAASISRALGAAGVGFAPVIDGVSTRRTTVAALLQHGLPVAGSDGRATDEIYRASAAFALAPVAGPARIETVLHQVLTGTAMRERMRAASRELYDSHLAWPRIADRYRQLLP
jgi:glycosyltransferase involved in cell wall biosynthesis